jgi:hypothetical protein
MNKYLEQLITRYENKSEWDIRAISPVKAMIFPVSEWLSIFNSPTENNCFAAFGETSDPSHKIQGLITQDKKYFIYEATPRYTNVVNISDLVTFIAIRKSNMLTDSLGYAQDYLYARSNVPIENRKTFSTVHTYLSYSILCMYPNFNDITSYNDFLNRYLGEHGEMLCSKKKATQALNLKLAQRLKSEYDFQNIDWVTYTTENNAYNTYFYVDTTKSYINKFSKISLDGGIYE